MKIIQNNERLLTSEVSYKYLIYFLITSSRNDHALLTFNNLRFPFSRNVLFFPGAQGKVFPADVGLKMV